MEIEDNKEIKDECIDISFLKKKYILYISESYKVLAEMDLKRLGTINYDSGNITKVTIAKKDEKEKLTYLYYYYKKSYADILGVNESHFLSLITKQDQPTVDEKLYEEILIENADYDQPNYIPILKLMVDTNYYYSKFHNIKDSTSIIIIKLLLN